MNDPPRMRFCERGSNFVHDSQSLDNRERPVVSHALFEVESLEKFHHDVGRPVRGLSEIVDLRNVRAPKLRVDPSLDLEAGVRRCVAHEPIAHELHRDRIA